MPDLSSLGSEWLNNRLVSTGITKGMNGMQAIILHIIAQRDTPHQLGSLRVSYTSYQAH